MDESLLDAQVLNELKELMGDAIGSLVTRYGELSRDYISAIQAGVAQNDVSLAVDAAHPLKSSSQQLAVMRVYELARVIEIQGNENQVVTQEMRDAAEQLPDMFERSFAALQAAI